jgi:outer membrane protein assembly factor BamB
MIRTLLRLSFVFAALIILDPSAQCGDWPGWRGPTGQGHTPEKDLPLTWDAKKGTNVLWKALLHSGVKQNPEMNSPGWSCPIVWGERVFITTAIWPSGLTHDERMKSIAAHHVLCYRAGDGELLWDRVVPSGKCLVDNVYHGYAVSTPVTDGKLVYAPFGSGVIAALDFEGNIVWREELPSRREVYSGLCGSPILLHDSLILAGINETGLRALDKTTGQLKWEQKSKENNLYATPWLFEQDGQERLIHTAQGVQGLDPNSGKLLWSCRVPSGLASPVYGAGLIYVDSGRGGQTGSAVVPGGSGDLTKTNVKWQTKLTAPAGSSGICVGDYLYRACNSDVLRCWKMATGELIYEERLQGISPSTSPIASADGRIYFASPGKSYVIKAGPDFELLATNDLGERDPFITPAVANGRIFIKGRNYLWCIGSK